MDLGRKRPADEAIFVPPSFASLDWIFPVPLCHPFSADLSSGRPLLTDSLLSWR